LKTVLKNGRKIIPFHILFIGKYCSKLECLKKSYLTGGTGFDGSTASDIRFTKGGNRRQNPVHPACPVKPVFYVV